MAAVKVLKETKGQTDAEKELAKQLAMTKKMVDDVNDAYQRRAGAALDSITDEIRYLKNAIKYGQEYADKFKEVRRLVMEGIPFNQAFDLVTERASLQEQLDVKGLNSELSETEQLLNGAYNTIANGLQSGIQGLIDGSKELKDVFSDILNQLANMALQFAFKSFGAGIGVPGFDGGGYTGDGARSGGLDGKGGFLSVLHPQETVIDHYGDAADALTSGTAEQGFDDSGEALDMATAAFAEGVAGRNSVSAAFADAGTAMGSATAAQLSNVSAQQEALQMAQLQSGASSNTIRYESSVINSISYVTEEQAVKIGMESAKKAEANVYRGLRNMPAVRGRSGVK